MAPSIVGSSSSLKSVQVFTIFLIDIGCAGEVHIKENDDYEKWAIEIYVKFRDKEELQLLTAQRQSGGVR